MTGVNLEELRARALRTQDWVYMAGLSPAFVREHFNTDVPALISAVRHLQVEVSAANKMLGAFTPPAGVRFALAVDGDDGHYVRFRLFTVDAAGGRSRSGCVGQLVLPVAAFAAFRALLEPALAERPGSCLQTPEVLNNLDPAPRTGIVRRLGPQHPAGHHQEVEPDDER